MNSVIRIIDLCFLIQCLMISPYKSALQLSHEDPLTKVSAVAGLMTSLPCNTTPTVPGDKVLLVLWYKDTAKYGKPLYSFDLRSEKDGVSLVWANEAEDRVNLNIQSEPHAVLNFLSVQDSDSGMYRCRVDFKKSPTRFKNIQLTVKVPPNEVEFLDERGMRVSGEIGPYREGDTLVITCDVLGGWPESSAVWYKNSQDIDTSWQAVTQTKSRNTLKLDSLTRKDQGSKLTCSGSNNNETRPVEKSLIITMLVGPETLEIRGPQGSVPADSKQSWQCISQGARPSPTLVWVDPRGRELPSVQEDIAGLNRTISTVNYSPSIADGGKTLECRAQHPALANPMPTETILRVKYKPQVWLSFGSKSEKDNIQEGDEVYLACSVSSNPPPGSIIWTHNGQEVFTDEVYIKSSTNLIIRSITSKQKGIYTCQASNTEGEGSSNPLQLSVSYVPRCYNSTQNVQVSKGERVQLFCPCQGVPNPTTFRWEFNNSVSVRPLHTDIHGQVSFTPIADNDYGQLSCWGRNRIGEQIQPCLFNILPTGKPEAVTNCSISNKTSSSLQIMCLPGRDNGAKQRFALQILASEEMLMHEAEKNQQPNSLIINQESPVFVLKSLTPGTSYTLRIYGINDNGDSEKILLKASTLRLDKQKRIDEIEEGPIPVKITSLVWVFLGILSVLVLVLILAGALVRISNICARVNKYKPKLSVDGGKDSEGTQTSSSSVTIKDDICSPIMSNSNPDIIPEKDRNNQKFIRRNSYNSSYSSYTQYKVDSKEYINTMYCTLPKKELQHRSKSKYATRNSQELPDLPVVYEQRVLTREDSSAEDLTAEGKSALLRMEPPPVPPEFADTPPKDTSPLYQIYKDKEEDLNVTRF